MGGICDSVERTDFSCSFCKALFTQSYTLAGDGEASLVFNVLVDAIAFGYILSALFLLFHLQRSYNYLTQGNNSILSSSSNGLNNQNGNGQKKIGGGGGGGGKNEYVQINIVPTPAESSSLWDKNTGITINHPKILMSTYFKHLLFVGGWLAFEGLLLLFLPPTSIVYPAAVTIVGAGHIITDNWILVFMTGKEDDKFSSRRSFYVVTLLYLLIMATSLADVFDNKMCKSPFECQLFMIQDPYTRLSMDVVFTIVYCICLFISFKKTLFRPTARIWIAFLLIIRLVSSIASLLLIFDVDFAYCFLAISSIPYAFMYGFLIFKTCGNDSNLLRARSEFEPLLNNFKEYQDLFGRESISSIEGTNALQLSAFYIRYNEFKFGEVIGGGYFGEVKKAIWKGALVAVKVLHRNTYRNTDNAEDNVFFKEVAILSILRHPNVLQFMGVSTEDEKNCIVTEYMGGGSLDRLLSDRYFVLVQHPELAWRIALDIAKGMFYLHDWKPNPILHRDLSTKNILLNESFSLAKVADFGLSREQGFEMTSSVGFLPFQAPEVFIGELYTPKADVYSFGILLYCLITGEQPNHDLPPLKFAHLAAYEHFRPPLPPLQVTMWMPLVNLCQMCWKGNPDERPTFGFILDFLEVNMPSAASTFFQRAAPYTPAQSTTTSLAVSAHDRSDSATSSDDDDDIFNRKEFHYIDG